MISNLVLFTYKHMQVHVHARGGKTKETCLTLGEGTMSFTVVPLFWWEGEGFKPQLHISSHTFSIPSSWDHNFLHLMGSTFVFHLLSPFSVLTIPNVQVILQKCGSRISHTDN